MHTDRYVRSAWRATYGHPACSMLIMGMFDYVRCKYPLPHHQDAQFQTKDLAYIVHGEAFGGFMEEYEISPDGRLMRHVEEREWREDADAFLGGYSRTVRDWWEEAEDIHGDVRIYVADRKPDGSGYEFTEFKVRFANGRVEKIREIEMPRETGT